MWRPGAASAVLGLVWCCPASPAGGVATKLVRLRDLEGVAGEVPEWARIYCLTWEVEYGNVVVLSGQA